MLRCTSCGSAARKTHLETDGRLIHVGMLPRTGKPCGGVVEQVGVTSPASQAKPGPRRKRMPRKAPRTSATQAIIDMLRERGLEATVDVNLVDDQSRLSIAVTWEVDI